MAKPTTDESMFRKIEGLVHEEQHLYGKSELADHDQVRLEEIKVELDQCWDLCASGMLGASSAKIRTRPRYVRRPSSSDISSNSG